MILQCLSSSAVTIDKYIMQKLDKIAEELFNKIRGRYPKVTLGTEVGEVTSDPGMARFFEFNYRNLGKVSVSLDEKNGVVVMYSKKLTDDTENKTQFFKFLRELRMFAKKRMLNFDTRDLTKSNLKKRDYQHLATTRPGEGTMTESKLYGTSRVSYQDVGSARLVVKHSQAVNPELAASRTQNIQSMYIESAEGERFKYPYKHLNGARALTRHVAEGGNAYDDFGKHIIGLSEELSKLRKFKNYMGRSGVMAEGLSGYMDAVHERIDTVKDRIQRLQKESFYKEEFESFETPVFEDVPDEVRENWIDQLTIRQFNEELADVFPYIYKLVSETTLAEEIGPEDLLGEGDKKDVLFRIEDEDGDKYEVVRQDETGQIVAFDANPEELPGGGMGPYEYDPKTGIIELEHGPKKTRKIDDQTFSASAGDPDKAIESSIEELMGQFSERSQMDVSDKELQKLMNLGDRQYQSLLQKYLTTKDESSLETLMAKIAQSLKAKNVDFEKASDMFAGVADDAVSKKYNFFHFITNHPFDTSDNNDADEAALVITDRLEGLADHLYFNHEPVEEDSKFDRNFTKRIAATAKGGKGAEYYSDKADQTRQQNKDLDPGGAKKGLGINVLDREKVNKLRKQRGLPPKDVRTSPNTRDPKRLPEAEQQLSLSEKILCYFDCTTGQFPKGETAVLTMIEKDYGEEYIEPAKQFIEMINNKVAEMYGYKDNDLEEENYKLNDADKKVMQKLTGMIKQKQKEMQDARKGGYDEDVRMIASQLEDFYSIAELIQGKRPMGLDTSVMDLVHDMYDEVGAKFEGTELDRIRGLAGL